MLSRSPSNRSGRRSRALGRVASLALAAGLVAACSAGPADGGGSGGSDGATLRIGVHSSTVSTVDAYSNVRSQDFYVRNAQIFEPLLRQTEDGYEWVLATEITSNADNTVWTVKLRPNVTFHDGSPFGADDVIAVFQRILDPANAIDESNFVSFLDPGGITKVDDLTVQFALRAPYGPVKFALSNSNIIFYEQGSTPEQAVGTGPFTLESFTPGRETVVSRFDGYWGEKPQLGRVEIISFKTPEALTNAVLGGQIDASSNVLQTALPTIEQTPGLEIMQSEPNLKVRIGMRTDMPPFDDVRVRQAMRLIVDRELALSNAFDGLGILGNDYEGFETCQPDVPQRQQDLAKAAELLAAAGQSNLNVTLRTAANKPGMLQLVQILAEDAKKIGVTIDVQKMDLGAYLEKWGEWPFYTGYDSGAYLRDVPEMISDDPALNHQYWHDPEFEALAAQLFATADEAAQCEIQKQMKAIQYERGPTIIAAKNPTVSVYASKVRGLVPAFPSGNLYDFTGVTIAED